MLADAEADTSRGADGRPGPGGLSSHGGERGTPCHEEELGFMVETSLHLARARPLDGQEEQPQQ